NPCRLSRTCRDTRLMSERIEARLVALAGVPLVRAGDDIATLVLDALTRSGERLAAGDALVIAQKIFSKAEGRSVALRGIVPSPRAEALARETRKDPRVVELILREA